MSDNKKQLRTWFNLMPEPYRTQAFNNTRSEKLMQQYDSLYECLYGAFIFGSSNEGSKYWYTLTRKIYHVEHQNDREEI